MVTVSPRPVTCQSVRHFQLRLTYEFWLKKKSFGFIPRCYCLVTCLVALAHAMAAAFNAQMGPEELVVQLNLMDAELSRRQQANEAEHQRLWDTIEETKSEVGNLRRKLSNVQHVLDGTTNTARQAIESLVRDLKLFEERAWSRCKAQRSSTRLTFAPSTTHLSLRSPVSFLEYAWSLMPPRNGCDRSGRMAAAAAAAAPLSAAGVPQAQPSQSSHPLLRANPWSAATNLGGSADSRPPTNGLLSFELDSRMWEGPSRDREPLEMSMDTTGYSAWRDQTLTVIARKYPAIRELLIAAKQEKGPIDDGVEVAVGLSLPVIEIRLLSHSIFVNAKLLLHEPKRPPRCQCEGPNTNFTVAEA